MRGGADYAFEANKPNLLSLYPEMAQGRNFQDINHAKSIDIKALQLALRFPGVKLYSLSKETPLNKYIPPAPVLSNTFTLPEDKPSNALADFATMPVRVGGKGIRFFRSINMEAEYIDIKNTLYGNFALLLGKFLKDTLITLRALFKIAFKIPRILFSFLSRNWRLKK